MFSIKGCVDRDIRYKLLQGALRQNILAQQRDKDKNAHLSAVASPAVRRRKGGNKTNNEYGLTATFLVLLDK